MYSHPEFPFSLIYKIRRTAHAVLAVFELLTFNRRYRVRWINPVVVVSRFSFQPSAPRHGAGRKYYGNYAPKDEMGSCYGDSQIERIKSPLSVASKREAQVGKGREGEKEREKKKETKTRNRRERTRDE